MSDDQDCQVRHKVSDDGKRWRAFDAARDSKWPPLFQRREFTFPDGDVQTAEPAPAITR